MKPAVAKPLEISDVASKAIAVREPMAVEKGSPLDLPPAQFRAGLERRKENRKALLEWIRAALVDGIDFAKIHVVGKARCGLGNKCDNPEHFSKPVLLKPGAEKICGMLGVIPTFPRLADYEQACLNGVTLKQIILRCEMTNPAGEVVAVGVGARNLEQDYNDINKSLKMSEKSSMSDAVLRMGGLSEVFTQDEDDNFGGKEFQEPQPSADDGGYLPKEAEGIGETQRPAGKSAKRPAGDTKTGPAPAGSPAVAQTPAGNRQLKPATEITRQWMIDNVNANPKQAGRGLVTEFFRQCGWLLPSEQVEDLELRFVPATKQQLDLLVAALNDFSATGTATKPYNANPEAEMPQEAAGNKKGVNVPLGTPKLAQTGKAAQGGGNPIEVPRDDGWRRFPLPFGKLAGKALGDLADSNDVGLRNYLYGFWAGYEAKATYEGKDGKTYRKKESQVSRDKAFRTALDAAGESLGFTKAE